MATDEEEIQLTIKWLKFPAHTIDEMCENNWAKMSESDDIMFFAINVPFSPDSYITLEEIEETDLRWLQQQVGGMIEPVRNIEGIDISTELGIENAHIKTAYVDEEGLLKNKDINCIATGIAHQTITGTLLLEVEIND